MLGIGYLGGIVMSLAWLSPISASVVVVPNKFSGKVRFKLALRAAWLCSNPACAAVTSGPGVAPSTAANIGVAAHITAASANGPRYDPSITPQMRIDASNGIWLCQNCAKLIDSDEDRYTGGCFGDGRAKPRIMPLESSVGRILF